MLPHFLSLFSGLSSSDKYLQMQREIEQQKRAAAAPSKKGKKHKKKHKKRKGGAHSESEDDLPVLHAVSNTYETPEVRVMQHVK